MSDDFVKSRRERYAVRDDDGAGYGNRTRLFGLGSRHTTDVLILHTYWVQGYDSTATPLLQAEFAAFFQQKTRLRTGGVGSLSV